MTDEFNIGFFDQGSSEASIARAQLTVFWKWWTAW